MTGEQWNCVWLNSEWLHNGRLPSGWFFVNNWKAFDENWKHFYWLVGTISDKVNFRPIFHVVAVIFYEVVTCEICSLIWRNFITLNKSPVSPASSDRLNAYPAMSVSWISYSSSVFQLQFQAEVSLKWHNSCWWQRQLRGFWFMASFSVKFTGRHIFVESTHSENFSNN